MKKSNKLLLYIIIIISIIFIIIFNRYKAYYKLKNGEVTVGKTLQFKFIGTSSFIKYIYIVNNKKYIGTTQPFPFEKNDLIVPNGKYFVVFNKENPEFNVIIFNREATNYKLNIVYENIEIDKSTIKDALKRGSRKAQSIP